MRGAKQQRLLSIGSIIVVLLASACLTLILSGVVAQNTGATALAATGTATPVNTGSKALGIPAIAPRSGAFSASQPTFTSDDVVRYVNAHAVPQARLSNGTLTVTKVSFMTSQQVSILLNGESTGVDDDTLLCVAEMQGNVVFMHNSPDARTPLSFTNVYEVFDAHTGNLLMWGGLD